MKALFVALLYLIVAATCFAEVNDVGVFKKTIEGCTITIEGNTYPCTANVVRIASGSLIRYKGKITILDNNIDWMRKSATRLVPHDDGVFKVEYETPEDKRSLLKNIKDLVGYRVKHPSYMGATRSGLRISPEEGETILEDMPISFSWCGAVGKLIIKKESSIVYESIVSGHTMTISPQILQGPGNYSWEVQGGEKQVAGAFKLLNQVVTKDIRKDLQSIERDARLAGDAERLLAKVIYLQQLTESFSEQWHFNWLACQILNEGNARLSQRERRENLKIVSCVLESCN